MGDRECELRACSDISTGIGERIGTLTGGDITALDDALRLHLAL